MGIELAEKGERRGSCLRNNNSKDTNSAIKFNLNGTFYYLTIFPIFMKI